VTWIFVALGAVLLALWIPTIIRRAALENALRFGREFYGLDLTSVVGVGPIRSFVLANIKESGETTAQGIFFFLVPVVLEHLDQFKCLELFDGITQMRIQNAVKENTYHQFMIEFEKVNRSQFDVSP
jgi:hypothetical protein